MTILPQAASYTPAPAIAQLDGAISDPVHAANFPKHILRFRNDRWAPAVGLDGLTDDDWISHFGRFAPLPDNLPAPLALRYHGHQFRVYNPDIGDGRGFLFAQLRDGTGRLLDLGTKGSGQTPYSRFGDGRLTLKGGVREVLATEMLEALGAETSKTFSLIETGEALKRNDEPSPTRSAVLVRLNHSHIRIGTFQRLATLQDAPTLDRVVRYALQQLYDTAPSEKPAAQLLGLAVERTARLAASYMAAGFVHGVLNTDNINITGESFDYGPWRFTPSWTPNFTAAYFDQQGLYAFGRQAQAIHWDVVQLAIALSMIGEVDDLAPELDRWPDLYEAALGEAIAARLGITLPTGAGPSALTEPFGRALEASKLPIDRFFHDWRGGVLRMASSADNLYESEIFAGVRSILSECRPAHDRALAHDYWQDADPCSMHIDEVEAIWAAIAERDDWGPFEAKINSIRRMGEAMRGD